MFSLVGTRRYKTGGEYSLTRLVIHVFFGGGIWLEFLFFFAKYKNIYILLLKSGSKQGSEMFVKFKVI